MKPLVLAALFLAGMTAVAVQAQRAVVVGSKTFSESHVLAEIAAQYLEANGQAVVRKIGLGGTLISYQALVEGELDIYP
ncbi:MAG: hypothetical protein NWP69_02520, partial [Congregibacter sp.]|nr:hypothetical protein [Congregibacter sp.]